MIYKMNLQDGPFESIKNGTKTIEMRLYDEKRRKINVGDIIEFDNDNTDIIIKVEVIKLHLFKTFDELYNYFDKTAIGYKEDEMPDPNDMSKYYKDEDIEKYGVVGIEIKLLNDNKNLILVEPKLEEYYYEQRLLSDPDTMNYNAGYDVSYDGYHYDKGCIDFPESKWINDFEKRKSKDRFFAYIKDIDLDEYIGYVNYHYNKNDNRYECGIVIEGKYRKNGYSKIGLKLLCKEAFKNGIEELYDSFEKDRKNTLKVFESIVFKIVEETKWKKFGEYVDGVIVCIKKYDLE